jgi:hypothetical protein
MGFLPTPTYNSKYKLKYGPMPIYSHMGTNFNHHLQLRDRLTNTPKDNNRQRH